MKVQEKVYDLLVELLDIDKDEITPEATLITDLGASSVDLVEIVAALENEFDLDISDEEAQKMRTVKAIIDYVNQKTS